MVDTGPGAGWTRVHEHGRQEVLSSQYIGLVHGAHTVHMNIHKKFQLMYDVLRARAYSSLKVKYTGRGSRVFAIVLFGFSVHI